VGLCGADDETSVTAATTEDPLGMREPETGNVGEQPGCGPCAPIFSRFDQMIPFRLDESWRVS
jgi:hypothetical protein